MPVDRSPLLPAGDDSAPRIKLVDNMKAALICCVVLYHTAVVYTSADRPESPIPGFSGLMMVLKPVVMPGFCVISGFLSRADLDRRRAMKQWQLATVYVVFQALYFLNNLATYRLAGFPFDALPVQIFYSEVPVVTWFLFALAAWRTLLPVLVLLRAPLRLSLVVAHLALYVDLRMNYQNLLSFLPYFLGGFYLPPSLWALLARPAPRLALGGAFVAATAASILWSWLSPNADGGFAAAFRRVSVTYNCFNGVAPSDEPAACAAADALPKRALFYLASAPLLAGFAAVLPQRHGVWTVPGLMSMYIYLLHPLLITNGLVMKLAFDALSRAYGREVNVWSPADRPSAFAVLAPASLAICALLALPCVRALCWPLVEPPTHLLFRPPPERDGTSPGYSI